MQKLLSNRTIQTFGPHFQLACWGAVLWLIYWHIAIVPLSLEPVLAVVATVLLPVPLYLFSRQKSSQLGALVAFGSAAVIGLVAAPGLCGDLWSAQWWQLAMAMTALTSIPALAGPYGCWLGNRLRFSVFLQAILGIGLSAILSLLMPVAQLLLASGFGYACL